MSRSEFTANESLQQMASTRRVARQCGMRQRPPGLTFGRAVAAMVWTFIGAVALSALL